jgi:hypothetical protein
MSKISHLEAIPPNRLRVAWKNGKRTQSEVDVTEYLNAPGYERLRNPKFFASAEVEEWGHGVEWRKADIGIPADALHRLAKEQAGEAFPTERFNAWMKRHRLSLAAAAQALHLTRRTIIYYSTGAKPIPLYIGLACKGWGAAQRLHAARNTSSRLI